MTWVGFDEFELIEYRTRDGRVVSVSRYLLRIGEAWLARERILSTIGDHAVMGAWAGFGSVVLFLVLLAWLDRGPPGRGRRATLERAVATRPSVAAALARLHRRRCAIRRRCAGGRAADRAGDEDRGSGGSPRPRRSPEAADGLRAGGGHGQRQSRPTPGAGPDQRQGRPPGAGPGRRTRRAKRPPPPQPTAMTAARTPAHRRPPHAGNGPTALGAGSDGRLDRRYRRTVPGRELL